MYANRDGGLGQNSLQSSSSGAAAGTDAVIERVLDELKGRQADGRHRLVVGGAGDADDHCGSTHAGEGR